MLALMREQPVERVVLESTGGLQRRLVRSLQEAGYAVSVVNPERILAYRRLVGRVAKTDRIDARLIAEYGATMRPAASVLLSEAQQGMRELTSRRDQLIEAIAAEKKRLRRVSHEAVRSSLEAQIAFLEGEVKRLEAVIEEAVSEDETTRATSEILRSIPGVGKLTANLMAIDLPELGHLGDKQIASLAGVAPHPDESGKYRGRACIRGGRPRVRAKLYMSAFNAPEVQPGHRRVLPPSGVLREDVQAGDDGVHEEAAGADEHAGGPGPGLGPNLRLDCPLRTLPRVGRRGISARCPVTAWSTQEDTGG